MPPLTWTGMWTLVLWCFMHTCRISKEPTRWSGSPISLPKSRTKPHQRFFFLATLCKHKLEDKPRLMPVGPQSYSSICQILGSWLSSLNRSTLHKLWSIGTMRKWLTTLVNCSLSGRCDLTSVRWTTLLQLVFILPTICPPPRWYSWSWSLCYRSCSAIWWLKCLISSVEIVGFLTRMRTLKPTKLKMELWSKRLK